MRGRASSAWTPNFRSSRWRMVSKWRSPMPWISVWPSSELYSKWKVGSSSWSLCSPAASLSSSPRCFTTTADVASDSGSGMGGSRTGASRRQNVSPVCVSLSLATEPMSPALSALDLDPLLALLDRQVVELLGHLVLGVPDLVAVAELAGVEAEQGHVAHVRLGHGLEHPPHQRRLDRRRALGRRGEQLHHLPEQRRGARRSASRCRRRAGRSARPASPSSPRR